MILVAVCQVTLHLRRVHAAKRLRDVNRRHTQRRDDVARHPLGRATCCEGHREHQDNDRERKTQSEMEAIHAAAGAEVRSDESELGFVTKFLVATRLHSSAIVSQARRTSCDVQDVLLIRFPMPNPKLPKSPRLLTTTVGSYPIPEWLAALP